MANNSKSIPWNSTSDHWTSHVPRRQPLENTGIWLWTWLYSGRVCHEERETELLLLLLLLLHPFHGLFFRTTWVSRYQKDKTSLDLNEARDDVVWGCRGISWTICKQSAPHCRQITTTTPHYWIFTGRMLFLMHNQQCQSTEGHEERERMAK